ncbi:hypothetical protein [Bacillus sp. FJAT-22090]|uniref:hypothetical protein n=1 Tax=Bacillus sp. FJAT-22090 TaxID=1581038 RepID=UPI0011A12500|nr:hypothetical protein [Bacillus sp. FJAT-22090]
MLSRVEKYKKTRTLKKITIISGVLFLSISLGSGVKTALADQDIQGLLTNWFNNKKEESVQEIDGAVALETDRLMKSLEVDLQEEMKTAQSELANFTASQKQTRITALQEYANNLKVGMKIDNSEQEAAVLANLDAIINQAKAQMDGQATELKLVPIPNPEVPIAQEPVIPTPTPNPEATPATEKGGSVESAPITEVNPEPNQSTESKSEAPSALEPVEIDIYSITDWFAMPNVQNVTIEELPKVSGTFSTECTFSDIMMNPKAHEVMNSILRGIENHPQFNLIQYKTIDEMSRIAPSLFNEKVLFLLNKSLSKVTI